MLCHFKQQFYAPEPNLLFTNLGYLTKDILYWSSMGTSYFYSVFMGVLEILVGLLLLYRKTRVFGVLAALAVLTNVVAINFGFDISVKVFSLFLLFLVLMLLLLYKENVKPLLGLKTNFLIGKSRYLLFNEKPIIKPILKTLVVLLFLVEATYGNMASNNYNDDNFVFSELQGAYDLEGSESYSQLFIHRGGYLILKTHNDKMIDYNLELLELSREMHLLKDRNGEELGLLNYQMKSNGLLLLDGNIEGVVVNGLLAKPIALSDLPINEKGFHWTVD